MPAGTRAVRFWDLAGTVPSSAAPDYTAGIRLELDQRSDNFYLTSIVRARKAPGAIERLVADTAERDGRTVSIYIEQEPDAAEASADRGSSFAGKGSVASNITHWPAREQERRRD